ILFEMTNEINKNHDAKLSGCLKALGGLLGLLQQNPQTFLQAGTAGGLSDEEINALIAQRSEARQNKNWAESDRIRDELAKQGIILEDKAGETSWRRS
ncbi:MAG: cysteine--tRNA ligase, partial [Neisseriaceae bacterium]|nr:cysteine--tRNA ligase [Neisseriaceae bacterium]